MKQIIWPISHTLSLEPTYVGQAINANTLFCKQNPENKVQEIPLRVPYEGFNPQEYLFFAALFVIDIALLLTNHS